MNINFKSVEATLPKNKYSEKEAREKIENDLFHNAIGLQHIYCKKTGYYEPDITYMNDYSYTIGISSLGERFHVFKINGFDSYQKEEEFVKKWFKITLMIVLIVIIL